MADGEPFFCVSRLGIYAARCKKGLSLECDSPVIQNYAAFLLSNGPKSGIWACFFLATRLNPEFGRVSF